MTSFYFHYWGPHVQVVRGTVGYGKMGKAIFLVTLQTNGDGMWRGRCE
jgi:hypothetical protein